MKRKIVSGAAVVLIFSLPLTAYSQPPGYITKDIAKPAVTVQQNAAAGVSGLSAKDLAALKEKLFQAVNEKEINDAIASFDRLAGPNAEAAAVLLDYLRQQYRPGAWTISKVLQKLLSDEQLVQLTSDIGLYPPDNATLFLMPVLTYRLDGPGAAEPLYRLMLAFQGEPWHYHGFVNQAWARAFTVPEDFTRWLEKVYGGVKPREARGVLLDAAAKLALTQASDRPAIVKWLWRTYQKEQNPALQKDCLMILCKLGERKALDLLRDLYLNRLGTEDKIQLVDGVGNMIRWPDQGLDRDALLRWLEDLSLADREAASRQACLYTLHDLGKSGALAGLVRDVEKNGLALSGGYGGMALSWQVLKEMVDKHPQSYLARGIKAYEQVRGESYFAIVRMQQGNGEWPWRYGDKQYAPDREIPGWEKFLHDFPRHPAADDAAYRLARCYEISGRGEDALNTLAGALNMPDGDIRYHIAGRMVYILDVHMTAEQLQELSKKALDSRMRLQVEYSMAAKKIRQDDFQGAAVLLEKFISGLQGVDDPLKLSPFGFLNGPWGVKYDLTGKVKKQLEQVRALQGLKEKGDKAKDPAGLYNLAAAIYHNEIIYYNHLWLGQRQNFNWQGYINESSSGGTPEEMAAYAREMINYNHSAVYFKQVYDHPAAPPELKAKALYSLGLSYLGLYHWGEDAKLAFPRPDLEQKIKDTFSRFLREFPESSMADDALLALGGFTGDRSYLERLIKDYPQGDAVKKAGMLLEEMKSR